MKSKLILIFVLITIILLSPGVVYACTVNPKASIDELNRNCYQRIPEYFWKYIRWDSYYNEQAPVLPHEGLMVKFYNSPNSGRLNPDSSVYSVDFGTISFGGCSQISFQVWNKGDTIIPLYIRDSGAKVSHLDMKVERLDGDTWSPYVQGTPLALGVQHKIILRITICSNSHTNVHGETVDFKLLFTNY